MEDLVEGLLVDQIREELHLQAQRGRLAGRMPGDDLAELVGLQILDSEPAAQFLRTVP